MKSDVSPMWLTYFMVKWSEVRQYDSDQKCTDCGREMKKTEPFTYGESPGYEGYVCHADKRVTWVRTG
ncbi:MAG: hypothetical protein JRM73_01015 [Nitrososphaerota archaeon]|nr:hypothetical protein [Nitrososphaerota archaeon]